MRKPPLKASNRGYGVCVFHHRVVMLKIWDGTNDYDHDQTVTRSTAPKTLSLTLTRQGRDVKVAAKVALRDGPHKVFFSETETDRATEAEGPVEEIAFGCNRTESALPRRNRSGQPALFG